MTRKIKTGFISFTSFFRFLVASIATWVINACGHSLTFSSNATTPSATQSPNSDSTPAQISVKYLNPIDSNNPVDLSNVSTFPGVGLFNLQTSGHTPISGNCPGGSTTTVDYVFEITNTGGSPLTASSDTPVSVALLEDAFPDSWNWDYVDSGNPQTTWALTVTEQPSFPIPPGQSSRFTVRFNYDANPSAPNTSASECNMGWRSTSTTDGQTAFDGWGTLNFRLAIATNDPSHSNLSTDLSIWGGS